MGNLSVGIGDDGEAEVDVAQLVDAAKAETLAMEKKTGAIVNALLDPVLVRVEVVAR